MSNYDPYEQPQGDPWSTEPVGDSGQRQPASEANNYYEESSPVVARVPDLTEDATAGSDRHYGSHSRHYSRRRGPSRRPGVPLPLWLGIGVGLLTIALAWVFMRGDGKEETALEPGLEPPSIWQPPSDTEPGTGVEGVWDPSATAAVDSGPWTEPVATPATPATIDAVPGTPPSWSATPPSQDWVGAPANAAYGRNVGDVAAPGYDQQLPLTERPEMPLGSAPYTDPVPRPAYPATTAPAEVTYQPAPMTEYPATPGTPSPSPAAAPYGPSATVPPSNWSQAPTVAPTAPPQPGALSPGYSANTPPETPTATPYGPTASPVPTDPSLYSATRPTGSAPATTAQAAPAVPSYPATNPTATTPYPHAAPSYPSTPQPTDTLMARRDAVPSSPNAVPPTAATPPAGVSATVPPATGYDARVHAAGPTGVAPQVPAATAPTQPYTPAVPSTPSYYGPTPAPAPTTPPAYPSTQPTYPPRVNNPYAQPVYPAAPGSPPPYRSTGAATPAPSAAVARLNGVVEEPSARTAYDDSARPSFY